MWVSFKELDTSISKKGQVRREWTPIDEKSSHRTNYPSDKIKEIEEAGGEERARRRRREEREAKAGGPYGNRWTNKYKGTRKGKWEKNKHLKKFCSFG